MRRALRGTLARVWSGGLVGAVVSGALVFSGHARAQGSADARGLADALFREGRRLLDAGETDEACGKFEESQRLAPAGGTLLNVAVCHERQGRLLAAWADFQQAASRAASDGRADRDRYARDQMARLERELPHVLLVVPDAARVPGLALTWDAVAVPEIGWGTRFPAEIGSHEVVARARDGTEWRMRLTLARRDDRTITVGPLASATSPQTPPPASATPTPSSPLLGVPQRQEPPPRDRTTLVAGLAAAGTGLVLVGIGGYFGVRALAKHSDSNSYCPDGHRCSQAGFDLEEESRSAARTSNILTGLGLAIGIGGGVLALTSRRSETSVSFSVAPAGGGVAIGGRL